MGDSVRLRQASQVRDRIRSGDEIRDCLRTQVNNQAAPGPARRLHASPILG
ncbi:MAG TPA: hypothetical protein VFC19_42145 [Candidatus Limnocylindrales bacterium]|nr:hypothetical protein [Candidatus Limnocylindrales bacterium]